MTPESHYDAPRSVAEDRSGGVLLIEDNTDDLELTLYTFEQRGFTYPIHVVRDGREALEFLFGTETHSAGHAQGLPRMILLDLNVPRVDGLEFLRQVKADPRTQAIPVLVLTSSHDQRDLSQSYQRGAKGYLLKPIDYDKFIEVSRIFGVVWPAPSPSPRDRTD
jgi:two-component system response regulator